MSTRYLFTNDPTTLVGRLNFVSAGIRALEALSAWQSANADRTFDRLNDADFVLAVVEHGANDTKADSNLARACEDRGVKGRPCTFEGEKRWLAEIVQRAHDGEHAESLSQALAVRNREWGESDDRIFSDSQLATLIERFWTAKGNIEHIRAAS